MKKGEKRANSQSLEGCRDRRLHFCINITWYSKQVSGFENVFQFYCQTAGIKYVAEQSLLTPNDDAFFVLKKIIKNKAQKLRTYLIII